MGITKNTIKNIEKKLDRRDYRPSGEPIVSLEGFIELGGKKENYNPFAILGGISRRYETV